MTVHHLFPAITFAALETELARELHSRRGFYPKQVELAKMTAAEADWQLALAAAWQEDGERLAAWHAGAAERGARLRIGKLFDPPPPPAHGLSWGDRREALQRELALRDRHYPRWIETARMTQAEADHRRDCLRALALRYDDGWGFPRDEPGADVRFMRHQLQLDWPDAPMRHANARAWLTHRRAEIPATRQSELAL